MHQYVAVAVVALQLALRWGSLAAGAMWPDCQPPFSALQMQCSRWPIYASDAGGQCRVRCDSATCEDTLAVGRVSVCGGNTRVSGGHKGIAVDSALYTRHYMAMVPMDILSRRDALHCNQVDRSVN